MTENKNNNGLGFSGPCFSLFFNLIISQLFSGAISMIIEILRMVTSNILIKYFLNERFVKKYGMYIQPMIQSILLLGIGIFIFSFYNGLCNKNELNSYTDLLKFFMIIALISVFIIVIFTLGFWFYKTKNKFNIINDSFKKSNLKLD